MNQYLKKFKKQIRDASNRGIEWQLTFNEWYDIWIKSGHLEERGRKLGQYCMSRIGDIGPYSVQNVFIQLHSQNIKDAVIGNKVNLGRKATKEQVEARRQRCKLKGDPNMGHGGWNKGMVFDTMTKTYRLNNSVK